jgi:hypothetical protein
MKEQLTLSLGSWSCQESRCRFDWGLGASILLVPLRVVSQRELALEEESQLPLVEGTELAYV